MWGNEKVKQEMAALLELISGQCRDQTYDLLIKSQQSREGDSPSKLSS
jgi:hypothetical protein